MPERHVVFGCNGPVGRGLCESLLGAGHDVVGVCRSGQAEVPKGVRVVAADASDRKRAAEVSRGATVLHVAIGIPYPQWHTQFMPILEGVLHAARVNEARLVWCDNLYCYGPRNEILREDMAPARFGKKPALRARMADRMLEEHQRGRARVAIVRASDFIGPRARNAMLGDFLFARALEGKAAQFLGNPDLPHDFTYVPDLIRTQLAVAADEEAYGQAWHAPNPPTRTSRSIVEDVYQRIGTPAKISIPPDFVFYLLGFVNPLMSELRELKYQWTRPFVVDSTRVRKRFGIEPTDWDTILDTTLDWFRRNAVPKKK